MYSILILSFLFFFFFTTIHPKCLSKSNLFLKLYMLRERSSDIALFMKHPVSGSLKMYSVLILLFLLCFATFYPKKLCKSKIKNTRTITLFILKLLYTGAPRNKQYHCFFRGAHKNLKNKLLLYVHSRAPKISGKVHFYTFILGE